MVVLATDLDDHVVDRHAAALAAHLVVLVTPPGVLPVARVPGAAFPKEQEAVVHQHLAALAAADEP